MTIGEQELLRRVNKHSFKVKPPSKLLLDDPYFSPRPPVLEHYNNSVLRKPTSGCRDRHSVHIIVPSSPHDVSTRAAIRETWGSVARGLPWPGKALSLSVRLTFALGVADKANVSKKTNSLRGFKKSTAHSSSGWKNKAPSKRHEIDEPTDDILQFDMVDSYKNLTRKILLAMQWVVSSCQGVQYIVKADQDIFVNLPLLLSFLKHHGKSNSIYGHIYHSGTVDRDGRWMASKEVYPLHRYPVYASGTAYVVSRSAAETLLKLCPHFPYLSIEDAFITGILASVASVDRIQVTGFTHWTDDKPPPCAFINDKKYIGNNMTEFDLRKIWRRQIDRGREDMC